MFVGVEVQVVEGALEEKQAEPPEIASGRKVVWLIKEKPAR